MIDRKLKLAEYSRKLMQIQFEKSSREISDYCEQHSEALVSEFIEALTAVFAQVRKKQLEGVKGKVKYLVFSYMNSGIVLGEKRIRVDLWDERFYGDLAIAEAYMDLDAIYQFLPTDMEAILAELKTVIPRVQVFEMERVRYEYIERYQQVVKRLLAVLTKELDFCFFLTDIACEPEMLILFGGYMDKADILLTLKGNQGS